jgi:hypothetical protein
METNQVEQRESSASSREDQRKDYETQTSRATIKAPTLGDKMWTIDEPRQEYDHYGIRFNTTRFQREGPSVTRKVLKSKKAIFWLPEHVFWLHTFAKE